jgi:cysteine-rich repeat protein
MAAVPHRRSSLLAAGLGTLLGVGGCGGEKVSEPTPLGHLTLLVDVPQALPVPGIKYEIKSHTGAPLAGSIRIDELSRTVAAYVRGLPAAKNYDVKLSAASKDGDITCAASAGFEVVGSQTTSVMAKLDCQSRSGQPLSGMARNHCPLIQSSVVAPVQTALGGTVIAAVRTATAPDRGPLVFAWSGPGGQFGEPTAATTSFQCEAVGQHLLTVRVTAAGCADRAMLRVSCTSLACGNGMLDPGETCDDGNRADGDTCPADCILSGCGNGKIDPGETCEPPGAPTCDRQCRKGAGCGNGLIDPGEDCDDGNLVMGDGCAADCTLEALCGNGVVELGESCEPPSVGGCSETCRPAPSAR